MSDNDLMLGMNRAHNGRLVVLLFAANVTALFVFGGSAALWGMVLAAVTVAIAYLFEMYAPRFAEVVSIAASVGSALCFLRYLF